MGGPLTKGQTQTVCRSSSQLKKKSFAIYQLFCNTFIRRLRQKYSLSRSILRRERHKEGAWGKANWSASLAHIHMGPFVYIHLNDVFEAESAVTGQALAPASPTQILTVGPFGVNVAKFYRAGASSLFTALKNQSEKHIQKINLRGLPRTSKLFFYSKHVLNAL